MDGSGGFSGTGGFPGPSPCRSSATGTWLMAGPGMEGNNQLSTGFPRHLGAFPAPLSSLDYVVPISERLPQSRVPNIRKPRPIMAPPPLPALPLPSALASASASAVREDRTPGGKHRHKRMRTEEGASNVPTLENIIASTAPDTYNNELVRQLVEANPGEIPNFDCSHLQGDGPIHVDVNDLVQYGYSELRLIIEWARKVPGFLELLLEDQMALLKGSFMELNVLRLAFRSMETGGKVRLAEGLMLSPEKSIDIGWGKDLIMATQEFITRLQCISMDMTEFCILNAVVLTYPDAVGIQDKNAVSQLQGKILDSLRRYTTSTYPNMPRRYSKMLLRLPSLRTVSAKAAERFLNMTLDGSIKVNSLVLDMMT